MAHAVTLEAEKRTGSAGSVRAADAIPAILYGHGIKNEEIQVAAKAFKKVFEKSGYTTLVDLAVGGKNHNVLVREVQFHPLRGEVTHVDFYQVRLDEKVKAEVPLRFVGESAAVKDMAGVLVRNLDAIELEAFPQDLPHDIEVDISTLATFDATIHVRDLKVPHEVTVLQESEEVVALVQPPRSEQELEALSEEATEDVAAVETVGKEKAEEEAPAEGEAPTEKPAATPPA